MERMFLMVIGFMLCFGNSYGQLWKDYADSAKIYTDKKEQDKAFELYIKVREELQKDSAGTKTYAFYTNYLGSLYLTKAQFSEAESLFLEAKVIREKILSNHHPDYALTCEFLGRLYLRTNQLDKAEERFLEVKSIREENPGKQSIEYARSCQSLGVIYASMRQPEKAEPFFLEEKQIQKQININSNAYAQSCYNLSHVYLDMNQNEKAEILYLETKQLFEKLYTKKNLWYARTCSDLVIVYFNMGQYEKAEQMGLEAKEIRVALGGKMNADYAVSCNNLADLYTTMGQYKKAEPLFLESKEIIEKIHTKKHREYAQSCNNLGRLYAYLGEFENAEQFYLEAKQIREEILTKNDPDYAKTFNNLGSFYLMTGQYEKAETFLSEAKQIRGSTLKKDDPMYAHTCSNLGSLYQTLGQYKKAEPLLLEARDILAKNQGKEHPEYAQICDNLGLLSLNMGQYEKAEFFILEAKNILEKNPGKDHPTYANNCNNLALLYMTMGQYQRAEPLYIEAKQAGEKIHGKDHPNYTTYCNNLAKVYWNLNKPEKANTFFTDVFISQKNQTKKIFQFTNESEKQSYLKKIADYKSYFFSYGVSVDASENQQNLYDVSLANRNIILSSSQQLRLAIYNTDDSIIKGKYDSWITAREQFAFWNTKPLAERAAYTKDLQSRADELEKELTRLSSDFREQQQKQDISWQNIQHSLKPGEAAIEFAEFQYFNGQRWTDSTFYVAFVLHKDKPQPQLVYLAEQKQLENLLPKKSSSSYPAIDAIYTSANIYKLVWEPLEKYLGNVSKVYFAPAGLLHKLNLSNLSTGVNRILSDKYQLVQLNTTASVTNLPPVFVTPKDDIILYGGVKFDADSTALKTAAKPYKFDIEKSIAVRGLDPSLGIPDLPYSRKEVDDIAKRAVEKKYTIKIFKGVDANEESVKSLSGERSPAVLHLATHGKFFPEPKKINTNQQLSGGQIFAQSDNPLFRSVILMAGASSTWSGKPVSGIQNGILTAYEISNMYLPKTKMVVLSACETGLGDIEGSEGVYGLQRAFKIAGVQYLVMSLWKVPDNTTAEFMSEFYKNIFTNQSVDDAFKISQTFIRNRYKNEPHKWAAWILVR